MIGLRISFFLQEPYKKKKGKINNAKKYIEGEDTLDSQVGLKFKLEYNGLMLPKTRPLFLIKFPPE